MTKKLVTACMIMLAATACETTADGAGAAGGAGTPGSADGKAGLANSSSSGYSASSVPLSGQRGALGASAEVERELVSVGDTVYFALDSYSLDGQAQRTLDRQAAVLMKNGSVPVTIEGHADERGTREYNLALGERRASTVKDYLVAYGVTPGRVRTVSYGEERPAALGSSEADWAKNRRVVTVAVGAAGS